MADFTLTAAPVQQGLFSPSLYEKRPEPVIIINDARQTSLFAETSNMNLPDKNAVAKLFADKIKATLTAEQWHMMRDRNQHEPDGYCASQDFCDAGLLMTESIVELLPKDNEDSVDVRNLYVAAWDVAKRDYLTLRDADASTHRADPTKK